MAIVLYADDVQSFTVPRYAHLPRGLGIKLGLEQQFGFWQEHNSLYKKAEAAREQGRPVILDPKLLGTPGALRQASSDISLFLKPTGFTIAAQSGIASVRAAVDGRDHAYACMSPRERMGEPPLIFGVAELSSKTDRDCRAASGDPADTWQKSSERLIRILQNGGADGVVCTSREILQFVRREWPKAIILATSLRPEWATWVKDDDQQSSITPKDVVDYRVEYVAVGRIARHAPDPAETLRRICVEVRHPIA